MLSIPIISEFNGKGIQKAIKEFKQLETKGQKAAFVLKKAGQAAAVGFAALGAAAVAAGAALWSFAKMAMDDQKSQKQLAASIKAVTKATDGQIKATEEWILKTQLALGVADTDLRSGLARLVRSTKDVGKAQKILNVALDVSAATGKDLSTVVNTLGRAMDGKRLKTVRLADAVDAQGKKVKRTGQIMVENLAPLTKLGLGFTKAELAGMKFNDVMDALTKRYGGSAATAAETFEGKVRKLSQKFGEMKESLGTIVLEYLTKLVDFGDDLGKAYGKDGFAGALSLVNDELQKMLFFNKNGELTGLGKTFNMILKAGNIFSRAGQVAYGAGYTIGGAFATVLTGKEGYERYNKGFDIIEKGLKGSQGTAKLLPDVYTPPKTPVMRSPNAGPVNGPFNPLNVNVYFTGLVVDPAGAGRTIKQVLNQYERRIGRATP